MVFVIDVGTTVLKAAVFSKKGEQRFSTEKSLVLVPNSDPLHHEIDAESWIDALRSAAGEIGTELIKQISAIVVSGNGPTLVPIGEDDLPLSLAMTWMDRRCIEESKAVSDLNGFYVDPTFYLPKAYWIFRNKREVYQKTKYFFSCSEYINYLLTGIAKTVLPVPEYRPYIWTEDLVGKLGMDWEKFPDFVKPADYIGETAGKAAELFGLPSGIPVFAGGPDFIVSLIGTATTVSGRACDRSGTSEGINLCTDTLTRDKRLICVSHVIEGLYNISGPISTSGKALEWFKTITGRKHEAYENIFEDLENVKPGSGGPLVFLPYLAGERAPIWDSNARGAFLGLTLNHGRREMTRAVVESVGFAIRHVITVMEEMGLHVDEMRITGSQAKSSLWNQIKADITGKKILVPEMKESELAGNLCIGLVGLNEFTNLSEAAEAMVRIETIYTPDKNVQQLYDDLFSVYRDSYNGLKSVFHKLSNVQSQEER